MYLLPQSCIVTALSYFTGEEEEKKNIFTGNGVLGMLLAAI